MAKQTYAELLQHPRWQAKRLEVFQREDFACQWCGDRETTLHVHHTYYVRGAKPWEYDLVDLLCLCKNCHEVAGELHSQLERAIGVVGRDRAQLERLVGQVTRYAEIERSLDALTAECMRVVSDPALTGELWGRVDPLIGGCIRVAIAARGINSAEGAQ